MGKIGRNEPCPCGSGKKFKRCCLGKTQATPVQPQPPRISVRDEVARLQRIAGEKKQAVQVVGVFIFFATAAGDAWLLELTEKDAVLVAKGGDKVDVEIEEDEETIEINWSHQFEIKDNAFVTTAYADKTVESHEGCPVKIIREALLKIQKSFSSELLDSIHVD